MGKTEDMIRSLPCTICGKSPVDVAHIRSKGSGGPNKAFNYLPLCRTHHALQHTMPWSKFLEKFPIMKTILKLRGWELEPKLWHPDLAKYIIPKKGESND